MTIKQEQSAKSMWKCPKCGKEFKYENQSHNCGANPTNIDEYIAAQPDEVQLILRKVRDVIRAAAPDAEERISWQMPTFWQGENLMHFAAQKKHLGLHPGYIDRIPFAGRLATYKTSKGAIQFPYDKPIDYELIADIVRWRVSCVEKAGKSDKDMDTSRMTRKVYDIPGYIAAALDESMLWERYRERPPYQRNDYIGWITRGKREETRQKRLAQMLDELQAGGAYMGMAYSVKPKKS
jgi:uncharacterized protein YdhG (YjbR/CyaY superfamily)